MPVIKIELSEKDHELIMFYAESLGLSTQDFMLKSTIEKIESIIDESVQINSGQKSINKDDLVAILLEMETKI